MLLLGRTSLVCIRSFVLSVFATLGNSLFPDRGLTYRLFILLTSTRLNHNVGRTAFSKMHDRNIVWWACYINSMHFTWGHPVLKHTWWTPIFGARTYDSKAQKSVLHFCTHSVLFISTDYKAQKYEKSRISFAYRAQKYSALFKEKNVAQTIFFTFYNCSVLFLKKMM
jgi:hypothetical protein